CAVGADCSHRCKRKGRPCAGPCVSGFANMNHFKLIALALLLLPVLTCAQETPQVIEPEPAERVPLADESLILDVIRAGERHVAVGARGHVLTSPNGRDWTQAEHVPVRST